MIMAQTVGAFQNCACMTSSWAGNGGYLDFTDYVAANTQSVAAYWIEGTVITCVVMSAGMGYIVLEVSLSCFALLQSGLKRTNANSNHKVATSKPPQHRKLQRCHDWSQARASLSESD